MSRHTPEQYADRLLDLCDAVLAARQTAAFACQERDKAIAELGRHLGVADGDERVAVVGEHIFAIARRGDAYAGTIRRIHAQA